MKTFEHKSEEEYKCPSCGNWVTGSSLVSRGYAASRDYAEYIEGRTKHLDGTCPYCGTHCCFTCKYIYS